MKNFMKGRLFRLICSTVLGLALFFITPGCLSFFWKVTILGTLFTIINLAGPFTDLGKRIPIVGIINKVWVQLNRVFVGGLFIFSGTIKSNDPTGFSYKLQEYMEVFKEDFKFGTGLWEYFEHHSLGLAIVICVSEVALGFMLLIGWKRMLTLWLLLGQIVFFTFLTFYSGCYNKVTGCGCFGDFIKLAPWESFGKDIVLLVCIAFLFAGKENINPIFKGWKSPLATILTVGLAVWFPIYTYRNLPVFDFLAYKEGNDLCELQKPGRNYKPAVYKSYFVYKNLKSGKDSLFDQDHMPWQDTLTWQYVSAGETKLISKEIDGAPIIGFSITDLDGNELKDSLLGNNDYYFLLIYWSLDKAEKNVVVQPYINDLNRGANADNPAGTTTSDAIIQPKQAGGTNSKVQTLINSFYLASQKDGKRFLAVSSASAGEISKFKFEQQALYDFAVADGVLLKTMIRSNPGLMLMKSCKVIKKWHYNNFPSYEKVKQEYFK
jgi:hypothetical protein